MLSAKKLTKDITLINGNIHETYNVAGFLAYTFVPTFFMLFFIVATVISFIIFSFKKNKESVMQENNIETDVVDDPESELIPLIAKIALVLIFVIAILIISFAWKIPLFEIAASFLQKISILEIIEAIIGLGFLYVIIYHGPDFIDINHPGVQGDK